ncbi:MAG: hypothetical protein ABIJ12_13845 [bacterium]
MLRYFEIDREVRQSTLIAWAILIPSILIILLLFVLLQPSTPVVEITNYYSLVDGAISAGIPGNGGPSGRPVVSIYGNTAKQDYNSGYRGSKIKIVREGPAVQINTTTDYKPIITDSVIMEADGIGWVSGTGVDLGSGYGYGYGEGFGLESDYKFLENRNIQFAYKISPSYPFVASEAGKSGEVEVLLCVGVDGSLIKFAKRDNEYYLSSNNCENKILFEIIDETPKGWYFADNLKRVIPFWKFLPHIEDGKPIPAFLNLTWHYCLDKNCGEYTLTSKNVL